MSMNQSDANSASGVLYMLAHQPSTSDVQKQSLLRVSKHLDEQITRMNQPLFNPPAFPRDHAQDGHNGMDLRDYFAAHANIGNVDELTPQMGTAVLGLACPDWAVDARGCLVWWAEYRAALRFIEADAMLKERDK